MGKYAGSLRTHEHEAAMAASIELEGGRVRIAVGNTPIGDWSLKEVAFEKTASGYRVAAEGEHILLDLDPSDALALGDQLSHAAPKKGKKRRRRESSPSDHPTMPEYRSGTRPEPRGPRPDDPTEKGRKRLRRQSRDDLEPPTPSLPDAPAPTSPPTAEPRLTPVHPPGDRYGTTVPIEPAPAPPPAPTTHPVGPPIAEEEGRKARKSKTPRERQGFLRAVRTKTPHYLDKVLDFAEPKLDAYLPPWVFNRFTVVLLLVGLLAVPFFPGVMSTILLVIGGLIVAIGAVAYSDSVMSSRLLHGRTTPTHVLVVGVVTFTIGLAIAVVAS